MRAGEQSEFERVFRSAYRSVLRTAYVVLRDRGRAEEVTQDAFLKLYEHWPRVQRMEHPEAWVRKVAVNAAIKRAQRERAGLVLALDDQPVHDERPLDPDVVRSLSALSAQQRACVALYYLEDRPVDEVSELMGVSTSTVKQHLFRARAHLAVSLVEEVFEDAD